MPDYKPYPDARSWLSGEFSWPESAGEYGPNLYRAVIHEGLSKLTEMSVLIRSWSEDANIGDIVGRNLRVHLKTESESERVFSGVCISAEKIGYFEGNYYYLAEVRPWFWLLTRTQDCRVFQEKTVVEIITEVVGDSGFSDYLDELTGTYSARTYCVQYRESDYDFLCRLMEEEGIYFYFKNDLDSTGVEKLVLCDSISGHSDVPGHATIDYHARQIERGAETSRQDHIAEWTALENLTRGKVTLNDFDFKLQNADLKFENAIPLGEHSYTDYEVYDYLGHHRYPGVFNDDKALGEKYAAVRMEAEAARFEQFRGAGNVRALAVGQTFALEQHPDDAQNSNYLITGAEHFVQDQNFLQKDDETKQKSRKDALNRHGVNEFILKEMSRRERASRRDLQMMARDFPEAMAGDAYACTFRAIPKVTQYRAPLKTPWPKISGPHTATVVGEAGEEIYTDEFGRIKVQFHWDRLGEKNENSSCWVRVMTPWSGTDYGMVAIPRIGQEAVIQFEEGDPDRPICTGMIYNAWQKAPYDYPNDKTQLGIRTKSTKEGGAEDYNELMFEDLKGEELMRVQAQKDHQMLVKNKSVVTIGQGEVDAGDHDDEGSLSEVIRNNVTRTIQEGNHYHTIAQGDEEFKIETGSQTIEIATDKTQTITENYSTTVENGDHDTAVSSGNMSVGVDAGKIEIEAAQSIELKVGGSSIKIEPAKITIKSTMIDIKGDAKVDVNGAMTNVKASGILVLKGSLTKIN
ncbi:type VI secretion system tip protein TssI/VgrG [Sedimentitalea sp. HM32M-2]|uniref:type VI secretion system Vgr family protein n=1 Tax=Sedimentitalea sp. HM32M-2 TaxID=3351566 RepID=UPI00363C85EA